MKSEVLLLRNWSFQGFSFWFIKIDFFFLSGKTIFIFYF